MRHSIDSLDNSDFIQGTLALDGTDTSLYAYAAADGSNVSTSRSHNTGSSLSGGNEAGLFNSANKTSVGGANDLGGDSGVTPSLSGLTNFDDDIAAVFLYDNALTPTEVTDSFNANIIPEPGTAALFSGLLAAGGFLLRRRS